MTIAGGWMAMASASVLKIALRWLKPALELVLSVFLLNCVNCIEILIKNRNTDGR